MPSEAKVKHGLWENGKRIKWFSEEEVEQIKKGELDYRSFFALASSRDKEGSSSKPFQAPDDFHDRLEAVESRLNNLIQS